MIKDEKTFSEVKKESFPLAENYDSINETISRDEKYDCAGSRDEKGGVIEDSVFKLFNDSGGKVRKRSSECITGKCKLFMRYHSYSTNVCFCTLNCQKLIILRNGYLSSWLFMLYIWHFLLFWYPMINHFA